MPNASEKLVELLESDDCPLLYVWGENMGRLADYLIAHGVAVQNWIPVNEPPKKPGEYIVAQKHWCDGHLESKKGKWNGVDWFVDGRESLLVAYWMPMPEPPKEDDNAKMQ